jgi:hypothetical protein
MSLVAIALAAAVSGTPGAGQFDLICTGTTKTIGTNGNDGDKPQTVRYRIDLDAGRWCEGDCAAGLPIQSVTADNIVLIDRVNGPPIRGTERHSISRIAGTVESTIATVGLFMSFHGACAKASFTPLPTPKF